jgi:pyruvate kinase
MLSGETANGAFPVNAVEIMAHICKEAEGCYNNHDTFWARTK